MAAFFGASVVAVSAYYMHRKTLNQLLEFAKAIERERDDSAVEEEEYGDLVEHLKKYPSRTRRKGRDRRESASMPDVTALSGCGGGQVEDKIRNGTLYVDAVPGGLPRLHVVPEGKPGKVNSTTRVAHLIRPTSPKSPAVSAAAFESIEGSGDEDNMTDNSKLDISYIHTNGKARHHLLMKSRSTVICKSALKCGRVVYLEKPLHHGRRKLYLIPVPQSQIRTHLFISLKKNLMQVSIFVTTMGRRLTQHGPQPIPIHHY